jgi:hypothetical protein
MRDAGQPGFNRVDVTHGNNLGKQSASSCEYLRDGLKSLSGRKPD